jgi:hypothetical protein
MELSFPRLKGADAGYLAQELERGLRREGVPGNALAIERSSPEHMDLGTVLGVNVDVVLHAIGSAGYIACFVKCIHEVVRKHDVVIRISTKSGSIEIPASEANADIIEKAITELRKPEDAVPSCENSE